MDIFAGVRVAMSAHRPTPANRNEVRELPILTLSKKMRLETAGICKIPNLGSGTNFLTVISVDRLADILYSRQLAAHSRAQSVQRTT